MNIKKTLAFFPLHCILFKNLLQTLEAVWVHMVLHLDIYYKIYLISFFVNLNLYSYPFVLLQAGAVCSQLLRLKQLPPM